MELASRTSILSFDWRALVASKKLDPAIETTCLTSEAANFDTVRPDASGRSPWHAGLALADHGGSLARLVQAAGCEVWSANAPSITRERVEEAKRLKLRLYAWTVNDPREMERLIDLGVDGIVTDYPDRLRKVLERKQIPWH
jgi:glycerophosphoryl diester phosphodiesterase